MTVRAPLPAPALPPPDTERLRVAFDAYLRSDGYTILTANKSAAALHTLVEFALAGLPLPDTFRIQSIRALRWLRHLEEVRAEVSHTEYAQKLRSWLEAQLKDEEISEPAPKKRQPRLDKLNATQWRKLEQHVELSESPEALVMLVAMQSPLRIGAILESPLDRLGFTLSEGMQTRLRPYVKAGAKTLRDVLASKTPNAAYVRMKRYVHELSEELGFDFDFNTVARSRGNHPKG